MQNNWNSMLEQMAKANEQAVAAATQLNTIALRTQGLMARKQIEAFHTCLDAGTKQMKLMSETRDPKDLVERQVQMAASFGEKMVAAAQEGMELQIQVRDELARWFESGFKTVQASVEDLAPVAAPAARAPARRRTRKAA